jgi:tetratricopeptide (TPR) repeat protein
MIFFYYVGMTRDYLKFSKAETPNQAFARAFSNFLSSALPDAWKMVRLEPKNSEAISMALVIEFLAGSMASGDAASRLPDETRADLRKGVSQLKRLVPKQSDSQKALTLTSAGLFEYLLQDKLPSEADLRRAIALSPQNDLAWDTLITLLATDERWPELLDLCRERAKYKDSTRSRRIAARTAAHLGKPQDAMSEIHAALQLDPKDVNANLILAILLLREGSEDNLDKAEAIVRDIYGRKDLPAVQWRDLTFLGGICYALKNENESAKSWLTAVLNAYPGDSQAKAALKVLTAHAL